MQLTGFDPVQTPPWHVSVCVHALPSLQLVPFAAFGFEHCPVLVSHVPAVWHWSSGMQLTGFEPVQTPFWQVSVCVHALPSLQGVPLVAAVLTHRPVSGLHAAT
jgi:hypothetical protein